MAEVKKQKGYSITPRTDGWRRAGREWVGTTEVLESELTALQIKQLTDDSRIIINKIEITEAK